MLAALALFLGHLFPVWLNFGAERRRGLYRRADRAVLAGRGGVLRAVGRDRRDLALSSLSAAGRELRHADFPVVVSASRPASLFAVLTRLLFYMHRENIKAAAGGHRGTDREKSNAEASNRHSGHASSREPQMCERTSGISRFRVRASARPGMTAFFFIAQNASSTKRPAFSGQY